ncbi:hypothetical protein ABTN18_19805, partial [Acinetobacter baumannii]
AGYIASVPLVRRAETPLRIYAFIEMAIAGFAIAIPALFSEKCSTQVLAGLTTSLPALLGQEPGQYQSPAALIQDALYLLILFLPAGL